MATATTTTRKRIGTHHNEVSTRGDSTGTSTSPDGPKGDIRFEYNATDHDLMGNLRRTINFMKGRRTKQGSCKKIAQMDQTEPLKKSARKT